MSNFEAPPPAPPTGPNEDDRDEAVDRLRSRAIAGGLAVALMYAPALFVAAQPSHHDPQGLMGASALLVPMCAYMLLYER